MEVKKIIEEKLNTVYALLVEQKIEETLDFYTDDCILIPQGASEVKGKKELLEHYKTQLALLKLVTRVDVQIKEVFDGGNIVTLRYTGKAIAQDDSVLIQYRAMTVWKKIDGNFFIHNVIVNRPK
ncbi:uncharacterized protein LOC124437210 [Xenia sp. Carnegie-2017]|uniref:uncharacterized protein LOC124437210 n=1 Tax=Xenia sp. Carnegie-2017 TaxID=2897299 RepID=UPI001F0476AE|nr:uncharacterized protein LOC124437210 [Xenia sp. Carnegie-2017]